MISKRAQNTLAHIRAGRFYGGFEPKNPATIKELADAGLIVRTGRPVVIGSFWVPATDYTPYVEERFGPVTKPVAYRHRLKDTDEWCITETIPDTATALNEAHPGSVEIEPLFLGVMP